MTTRQIFIALGLAIVIAAIGYNAGRFWAYLIYAVAIAGIGALSLNLLIGFCGQITFAQGALIGVGAYTAGISGNAGWGSFSLLVAGVVTALVSLVIGLPALRLRGLYFAISTLAAQFILVYLFKILQPLTNGVSGLVVSPLSFFGRRVASDQEYAVLCVGILFLSWLFLSRVTRTHVGRSFLVLRESELVARGMGIDVSRAKMQAFLLSGFFAGICGALVAFTSRLANPEAFEIALSVDQTAMIIVGGLGSLTGSIIGAAFVTLLPEVIERLGAFFSAASLLSAFREMAFGVLIILFLLLEPRGLVALLRRLRPQKTKKPVAAKDQADEVAKMNRAASAHDGRST